MASNVLQSRLTLARLHSFEKTILLVDLSGNLVLTAL
eukprot:COSAG06_NODE_40367_length_402_cov_1.363036_1_plen_36_part_10